jgi:hypothetical protein
MSMLFVVSVSLICGARFFSDVDYGPYVELFNETPKFQDITASDFIVLYGEPGYLAFTSIVKSIGFEFVAVTMLFSIVSIVIKMYVASRVVRQYLLVVSLYLCLHFITVEFIELRWALSSSLVIMAIYNEISKRSKLAFLLIIFASIFHYFSLFFLAVLFFRFFSLKSAGYFFVSSFLVALLYKFITPSIGYSGDSEVYMIRRLFRYINEPESSVGVFSYLRIVMYFSFYVMFSLFCNSASSSDKSLAKVAVLLLSCSLLISFVPLLYFRSMVVSDFFAISLLVIFMQNLNFNYRILFTFFLSILFCTWNILDAKNYEAAGYIYNYQSWFKFLL